MKNPRFLVCLVFVCISLSLISCELLNDSAGLTYIRRITKVSLPRQISVISEFDQGEIEMGGKYRIFTTDIKMFLDSNVFHPIDQEYRFLSHFNDFSKVNHIPASDSLYMKYLSGCEDGNSWLFTLNEKTGELWIEVQYPDFGGDGPSCKI
jgi:hypothetical protein